MINVWDYYGAGKVRLTTVDGDTCEGYVINVDDAEENDEDINAEDEIVIETGNGSIYGFKQSEVAAIKKL